MLLKIKTIILSIFLLGFAGFAVAEEAKPEVSENTILVQTGQFGDGTVVQWVCPKDTTGPVLLVIYTTDGKVLQAELPCGQPI